MCQRHYTAHGIPRNPHGRGTKTPPNSEKVRQGKPRGLGFDLCKAQQRWFSTLLLLPNMSQETVPSSEFPFEESLSQEARLSHFFWFLLNLGQQETNFLQFPSFLPKAPSKLAFKGTTRNGKASGSFLRKPWREPRRRGLVEQN